MTKSPVSSCCPSPLLRLNPLAIELKTSRLRHHAVAISETGKHLNVVTHGLSQRDVAQDCDAVLVKHENALQLPALNDGGSRNQERLPLPTRELGASEQTRTQMRVSGQFDFDQETTAARVGVGYNLRNFAFQFMFAQGIHQNRCGLPDVPGGIQKMAEERRAMHGTAKKLEERLAEHEARTLIAQSSGGAGRVTVSTVIQDATPAYLALLAAKITGEANAAVLLAAPSGHLVFAQTNGQTSDMGALLRDTVKEFGGKGGGAKDFAQGSVAPGADVASLLEKAKLKLGA